MPLSEDRDASRSDQQAEDDEHDPEHVLTLHDLHDADDDEDHGEQPQHECHGEGITQ